MPIQFGAGRLVAIPTRDAAGAAIATPTPVTLGVMQDVSVDIGVDMKTLYGASRYPVAVGQGKGKIQIKAKYADINGGVLGSLFFGKTPSAALRAAVLDAASAVPGASPFTVTVNPPNSGVFQADLGVAFAATGQPLTRVASAPAAGQYSLSGNVYTFHTSDQGKGIVYSYEYSAASGGTSFAITNDLMGYSPSFSMLLANQFDGANLLLKFNRCVSGKLTIPLKNEDFLISDFEAEAFADAAGNIGLVCQY